MSAEGQLQATEPPVAEDSVPENQDQLVEGLYVEFNKAPLGRRIMALAIDWGIISAIGYVLFLLVFLVLTAGFGATSVLFSKNSQLQGFMAIAVAIVGFLIMMLFMVGIHLYFIMQEYKKGHTVGKKLFGLRVVSLDGNRLSKGQCVKRELYRYLDCFLMFPGLAAVLMSDKSQRLGDMFSGTMVVHSQQMEDKSNFLYVSQEDYNYLLELLDPEEITYEERHRFLEDAYQKFIINKKVSKERLEQWAEYFRTKVKIDNNTDIDDRSLLLFIAEYCFQKSHFENQTTKE